jgi:hypothetical protein
MDWFHGYNASYESCDGGRSGESAGNEHKEKSKVHSKVRQQYGKAENSGG